MGAWRSVTRTLLLITLSAPLTVACSDELAEGNGTVGETEIRFATGVVSANTADGSRAATRANYDTESYSFSPLTLGTKVHIKTEGTWTGKTPSEDITHYTKTGTAETAVDGKSPISSVGIFWDDYGMGDPANTASRTAGLNVYAACVDGYNASAIGTIADWTALTWTLPADQSATATWKAKDLLVSNNNSDNADAAEMNKDKSGRYKFDTQLAGTACNLELHHAMSKITVNLKAGDGFPVDGKGVSYFENDPSVTLTKLNMEGTVNVKTMTVTPAASPVSDNTQLAKATIAMTGYTATYEGLIIPGNEVVDDYCDKATHDGSALQIRGVAQINCDGNIFNIYANELMDAMKKAEETSLGAKNGDTQFHSGKNYILNITVNKTEIIVKAYVTDWVDVTAEEAYPKIDVNTDWGTTGTSATNDFSFYLGENNVSDFGINQTGYYSANAVTSHDDTGAETVWTLTPQLYWPNHTTAYHFRGIWPQTRAAEDGHAAAVPEVVTVDGKQVVAVENVAYTEGTYPSDLMIGKPSNEPDEGITATEGKINLNFQYMMSQVVVNLTTEASGESMVDFGTKDAVNQADVQIIGGKTAGNILLSNLSCALTGDATDYTMHATTNVQRHDAVCPQPLAGLKFKITVKNSDGTETDTYTKLISEILVGGNAITAWEAGKKYIYNLHISKTMIHVSVSITDWVTVSGNQQIWF